MMGGREIEKGFEGIMKRFDEKREEMRSVRRYNDQSMGRWQ
jgi:ribosomal protein L3